MGAGLSVVVVCGPEFVVGALPQKLQEDHGVFCVRYRCTNGERDGDGDEGEVSYLVLRVAHQPCVKNSRQRGSFA
jgi:hypothetical protein